MKQITELHIGAGKVDLEVVRANLKTAAKYIVYLDRSYCDADSITKIESDYSLWSAEKSQETATKFCNMDIFTFMDSYKFKFNKIYAYRIFEHMEYCNGEIGRLLETCNMLSTPDAELDIIVPNAISLASLLTDYEQNSDHYDHIDALKAKLIINSEFCNIKMDPHASVWTPRLAKEYINSEGTWKVSSIQEHVEYAQRSIYMQILCKK